MRVVVLGAGVVGVASAYYLAEAGHEVVLIDRQPGPALETSFANAGEISPGYASPWAAPGIPLKAMRWLFMKHAPLILNPRVDMAMLRWIAAMLRNCTSARYALNKSRMVRLAEFSRDELIALRARLPLAYDQRSQGTLQLFRTQKQLDDSAGDIAVLEDYGVAYRLLGREVNLEDRAELQDILFRELALPATSSTSRGPSISTAELMELQSTDPHPVLHQLLVYRGAVDGERPERHARHPDQVGHQLRQAGCPDSLAVEPGEPSQHMDGRRDDGQGRVGGVPHNVEPHLQGSIRPA